jgi:hypothetical protein
VPALRFNVLDAIARYNNFHDFLDISIFAFINLSTTIVAAAPILSF